MVMLERITCEYMEVEDRIRITGEVAQASPVVIWLTQRILKRLIPVLTPLLADNRTDPQHAEILQVFAQQAARAEFKPQAPVQAQSASAAWVASSIDFATTEQAVTLTFRSLDGQAASFVLAALPLRQWLGILHQLYVKSEWSLDIWPEWIKTSERPAQTVALH